MKSSGKSFRLLTAALLFGATAVFAAEQPRADRVRRYTTRPGSQPGAIVAGPDGALWFTEPGINAIGRIEETDAGRIAKITTTGSISEFALPEGSQPIGIAAGPDGNISRTATSGSRIRMRT